MPRTLPRDFIKFEFVRYTRGKVLDLGHGPTKAFGHFVGVRRKDDPEMGGVHPDLAVDDLADLDIIADASCDAVMAADAFGAPDEIERSVRDWLRCIRDGGYLCIYEPSDEYKRTIMHACNALAGLDVVRFEAWEGGGWFVVLRKRGDTGPTKEVLEVRAPKSCIVVRHGGFGDQLQAAMLFPELKRQGYHITMLTTPKGRDIIEHDPHVDEWFMVDRGQVPNGIELTYFWQTIARHYDKIVNLNESVEGTFLATPGRPNHAWPQSVRHAMMNKNYAEFAAELAEIPFVPEGRFYPTLDEEDWASKLMVETWATLGVGEEPLFCIMWALSGSSPHKFSPWQDVVMGYILSRLKRAFVFFVGDDACRILEAGFEHTPRVKCLSGELSIRQTLTLARHMNVVIGPETGVLNSVAYNNSVAKVVLLSHSSQENLSKHWRQTHTIHGVAPCHPCHQLHHTTEFCPTDEKTGAAMCQVGMNPSDIYAAIDFEYVGWVKVHMLRASA